MARPEAADDWIKELNINQMNIPEMPDLNIPLPEASIYDVAGTIATVGTWALVAAAFFAVGYLLFTGLVAVAQYVVSKVSGN